MRMRVRMPAALASAALALHQLRYLLARGDGAAKALADEGHAYLTLVTPAVAIAVALGLAELALAWRRRCVPTNEPSLLGRSAAAAVALLLIYAVQESLEGILAAGHPSGLAAVAGGGGWLAIPIAIVLGVMVGVLLRATHLLLTGRARPLAVKRGPPSSVRRHEHPWLRLRSVLARNLAGRAPPRSAVS